MNSHHVVSPLVKDGRAASEPQDHGVESVNGRQGAVWRRGCKGHVSHVSSVALHKRLQLRDHLVHVGSCVLGLKGLSLEVLAREGCVVRGHHGVSHGHGRRDGVATMSVGLRGGRGGGMLGRRGERGRLVK